MKLYQGEGKFTEVGEDTVLGVSIKTLIALSVGVSIAVGAYYNLQAEIDVAKNFQSQPSLALNLTSKTTWFVRPL